MLAVNAFIARTIKWFLVAFGVATSMTLPYAIDIKLLTPMLGGLVDYTPSSVPALRHWGIHDLWNWSVDGGRRFPAVAALRDDGFQYD